MLFCESRQYHTLSEDKKPFFATKVTNLNRSA